VRGSKFGSLLSLGGAVSRLFFTPWEVVQQVFHSALSLSLYFLSSTPPSITLPISFSLAEKRGVGFSESPLLLPGN